MPERRLIMCKDNCEYKDLDCECLSCKYLQEYKGQAEYLSKERKKLLEEIEELKSDILALARENRQVNEDKRHISDLSKKESALVRENRELKRDVISLTRENRDMKDIIEKLDSLSNEKLAEVRELKKKIKLLESGEVLLHVC